jgi:ketosteroid isomerase-like protein
MSQENVEIVRGLYARWDRGDFSLTPEISEIFDPKVQTVWVDWILDADSDVGLEAFGATWTRVLAGWKEARMTAEEVRDAGDSVVVAVRFRAKGRKTDLPFEGRYGHLWTFRGGKVIRLEGYTAFANALEAVGLRE